MHAESTLAVPSTATRRSVFLDHRDWRPVMTGVENGAHYPSARPVSSRLFRLDMIIGQPVETAPISLESATGMT
jgi:hypothetical protein